MEITIEAGHGSVDVRTDDRGIHVNASGQRLDAAWSEVHGAGLAEPPGGRRPVIIDPEVVEATPLLGRVQDVANRLKATHQMLLIAHGPKSRIYQVSVPRDDPNVAVLVAELETRLGSQWLGVGQSWRDLKRALGGTTPFWYPVVGIIFVAGVIALALPAILAGATVRDAIDDLDPSVVEPWMLPVLAIWIILVGALLYRVRRVLH